MNNKRVRANNEICAEIHEKALYLRGLAYGLNDLTISSSREKEIAAAMAFAAEQIAENLAVQTEKLA